jgi:indoleamine 2,3-dioxygenase
MQSPFQLKTSQDAFDLSHGFLPNLDPQQHLPDVCHDWEAVAYNMPKLIDKPSLRSILEELEPFPIDSLENGHDLERAMAILSYLGHSYVWAAGQQPAQSIPQNMAKPWYEISQQLGRPPVLSYASYALYNWFRLRADEPIELGNIALLQNFAGGLDEEWFIMIHVDIERAAIPGLIACNQFAEAIAQQDGQQLERLLLALRDSLDAMNVTMDRMMEFCDPAVYYLRVRPFIHGWKGNPALPNGLIYTGVDAYAGKPQQFKGETGAQSTIIPAFDAALGVVHNDSPLKAHLDEMRIYMPPQHLEFLEHLEKQRSVRDYIVQDDTDNKNLKDVFNECVRLIDRFRLTHLKYAASYIQKQAQTSSANSTEVGTGGTPFMKYLSEHQKETEAKLL